MAALFNACDYLLDRHLAAGDGKRLALTGGAGDLSYAELYDRVCRTAAGLRDTGLQPEQRVLMLMADSAEFVTVYLAAMRIGAVPVPVSTMLNADHVAGLLRDSGARLLAATPEFAGTAALAAAAAPELTGIVAAGAPVGAAGASAAAIPEYRLDELAAASFDGAVHPSTADSPAFWLYTSGTTGISKAAMHRHGAIPVVCETYGTQVLGIRRHDRCLSAAKAFFAYGLGNSVLFPLSAGAATVLQPSPARPDIMADAAQKFGATLFFAGPTFFANMLRAHLPKDALAGVRLAASAGEALPAALYHRWTGHFGVDIIDGIGMTEMLHIFLSNRPGQVKAGTTGIPVPGYDLRITDENGTGVGDGEPGTLLVRGASAATGYWASYDASRRVFLGEWVRTGDTYIRDTDGYYTCLGRTGDMLKPSGIWVSPSEVEQRLLAHDAVGQAVVVAALDADELEKTVAFVILREGQHASGDELIEFCHTGLPSFKCPRRVVFTDAYPVTATGKIRRVELREAAAAALRSRAARPGAARHGGRRGPGRAAGAADPAGGTGARKGSR